MILILLIVEFEKKDFDLIAIKTRDIFAEINPKKNEKIKRERVRELFPYFIAIGAPINSQNKYGVGLRIVVKIPFVSEDFFVVSL